MKVFITGKKYLEIPLKAQLGDEPIISHILAMV